MNPVEAVAHLGLSTNQSAKATLETWHRRLSHRTLDNISVRYITANVEDMQVSDQHKAVEKICGMGVIGWQHKEVETKT